VPDIDVIAAFMAPRHRQIAREVTTWVAAELRPLPHPENDDAGRAQAREVLARMGEGGWIRHALPPVFGGSDDGPDFRAACLVREAMAGASPLADAVYALQFLGSMPVVLAGTDAQRQRWLPEVAAGRAMAAFAMTELEAGSDVAAIATTARRDGDGWLLQGRKAFISNAGIADFYVVFAKTDPDAGHRGLSCFLVPANTEGLRFAGAQLLSAPHPLGELALEECRLPADALLGSEGEGFKIGMATLDRLRATVGAAACGMAERALEEATSWALKRRQFDQALADFQLVQDRLARMVIDLTAARLLVYRAAWAKDGGAARVTVESAVAKAYATEAAQRVVDGAVQTLGGRGVLADGIVDHLYRSVRALRIYEGTTEVQHLVIARHHLKAAAGE